jgi:hypothetical protein
MHASDAYLTDLRQVWPVLVNPDSLLTMQQLLRMLGVLLLLIRGACSKGSSSLSLGLLLLLAGSGLRVSQWGGHGDYLPEGPIGGSFATACSVGTLAVLLLAAWKATKSARMAGASAAKGGVVLAALLALCACVATTNHLTVSHFDIANVFFTAIDTVDMCAAPFLLVAVCGMASKVSHLGGALMALSVAQVLSLLWFMDFCGMLEDPASLSGVQVIAHQVKDQVKTMVHGNPYALLTASFAIQSVGTVASTICYAVLRGAAPDVGATRAPMSGQPLLAVDGQRERIVV